MTEAEKNRHERAQFAAMLDAHGPHPRRWPAGRVGWAEDLTRRDPQARALLAAAEAAEAALTAPRRRDLSDEAAADRVFAGLAAAARPAPCTRLDWRMWAASLVLSGAVSGAGVFAFHAGYERGAAEAADLMFASPFGDLAGGEVEGLMGDAL